MATVDGAYGKVYSANQLVRTGSGKVYGLVINSHSSGKIRLLDGLNAGSGRILVDEYTLASGSQVITFPQAIFFNTGLFIDIRGTTVNYTVVWNEA